MNADMAEMNADLFDTTNDFFAISLDVSESLCKERERSSAILEFLSF